MMTMWAVVRRSRTQVTAVGRFRSSLSAKIDLSYNSVSANALLNLRQTGETVNVNYFSYK